MFQKISLLGSLCDSASPIPGQTRGEGMQNGKCIKQRKEGRPRIQVNKEKKENQEYKLLVL
jgi:hypothetical protein